MKSILKISRMRRRANTGRRFRIRTREARMFHRITLSIPRVLLFAAPVEREPHQVKRTRKKKSIVNPAPIVPMVIEELIMEQPLLDPVPEQLIPEPEPVMVPSEDQDPSPEIISMATEEDPQPLTTGFIIVCANPSCGNPFVPECNEQFWCSHACQVSHKKLLGTTEISSFKRVASYC